MNKIEIETIVKGLEQLKDVRVAYCILFVAFCIAMVYSMRYAENHSVQALICLSLFVGFMVVICLIYLVSSRGSPTSL
jgi:hypothetical protein